MVFVSITAITSVILFSGNSSDSAEKDLLIALITEMILASEVLELRVNGSVGEGEVFRPLICRFSPSSCSPCGSPPLPSFVAPIPILGASLIQCLRRTHFQFLRESGRNSYLSTQDACENLGP